MTSENLHDIWTKNGEQSNIGLTLTQVGTEIRRRSSKGANYLEFGGRFIQRERRGAEAHRGHSAADR